MKIRDFIIKYRLILSLTFLGIALRIIYLLLFTQMVDFINILALVRSVAETGNLIEGFTALKRIGFEVQLYGKIYYQVLGLWTQFLEKIGLLKIKYILDTKPFENSYSYLVGLWQWSPPHYQITAIKFIQFLWDGIFLFFLFLSAQRINKTLSYLSVLFWALNPYFMMINYAFFMPDIFMLGCFVGGIYFWIKAFEKKGKEINTDAIVALIFLILGAVIKQLPLLIVPFLIISINRSIKSFIVYIVVGFLSYLIFKQSWSTDTAFINNYFLFSRESMSILKNTFNELPYFLYFYLLAILFSIYKRKEIYQNYSSLILNTIFIITMVYLNDTVFFIQFVIWILPFAFLYSLTKKSNLWIFVLAMTAMSIKGWNNEPYLSFLLTPTIGSMYNEFINNKIFINQFFNFDIYDLGLRFLTRFIFFLIFIESIYLLYKKKAFLSYLYKKIFSRFSIKKTIIAVFLLYILFVTVDFFIKSRYVLLPQKNFQLLWQEIPVTKKPIQISVKNPGLKTLTALQLHIKIKDPVYNDKIVFNLSKNGKIFESKKISHFDLPKNTDDPYFVLLPKPIKNKEFKIDIYNEKDINQVVVYEVKPLNQLNKPQNNLFAGYEKPNDNEIIAVTFKEKPLSLFFVGRYEFEDIMKAFIFHASHGRSKMIFYLFVIFSSVMFFILSLIFYKKSNKIISQE